MTKLTKEIAVHQSDVMVSGQKFLDEEVARCRRIIGRRLIEELTPGKPHMVTLIEEQFERYEINSIVVRSSVEFYPCHLKDVTALTFDFPSVQKYDFEEYHRRMMTMPRHEPIGFTKQPEPTKPPTFYDRWIAPLFAEVEYDGPYPGKEPSR